MISVPVAVNNRFFRWQLQFWWHSQNAIYGSEARKKSHAIVVDRNCAEDTPLDKSWLSTIPHSYLDGSWVEPVHSVVREQDRPLNIQYGLKQILHRFEDDQILEVIDCDMVHIRPHPEIVVRDNMLLVSDIYEDWHLKSLTDNRYVIEPYFENGGRFYNGGFVPIIGKVSTLKKIIYEWEAIHRDLLKRGLQFELEWWAGMYALQAACEKAKVSMIAEDYCYVPGINSLSSSHYIAHYSCSKEFFPKYQFPNIAFDKMPHDLFYDSVRNWLTKT